MKIDQNRAQRIAGEFIAQQGAQGFSYSFANINMHERFPEQWNVIFDVFSAVGTLIDGPVVVVVDARNGEARFL